MYIHLDTLESVPFLKQAVSYYDMYKSLKGNVIELIVIVIKQQQHQ